MRGLRFTGAGLAVLAAVVVLVVAGRGADPLRPGAAVAQSAGRTVPRAECGPNDRVETGLQGQTTLAERMSGASMEAYTCNLELVGQYEGEGAGWQFASFDHCGYYGTANNPLQQRRGVVTVDVSDPTDPRPTAHLADRAMLDPWESLKVNEKRKLLGATKGPGSNMNVNDRYFSFYDIKDCANPKLLSELEVEGHIGHAGDFAPDGLTYYGTSVNNPGHLTAIDIRDPRDPKVLFRTREFQFHDITLSEDGTRMYAAQIGGLAPNFAQPNGLVILDVSDIQHRRPNPQARVISRLLWDDGSIIAQVPQPIRIKGKPYIVFTDEFGGRANACAQGKSPFGMARIIDISDETRPRTVSKLALEIHDPANCEETLGSLVGFPGFGYDTHYCTVDDPRNAKLVGCGHFQAGVRVFDIRDPYHPKEIAYYKPPARRTAFKPGGQLFARVPDRTADWASANVRFVRHEGELQLWTTSQDNGFQIVRFTNKLAALTGRDFDQDHPGNRN